MCRVVDPELHISLSWFENVYNSKCIISCKVILTLFLSLPDLAHNLIKFRFLLLWMNENSIFSYVYHQNLVIFGFSFILWTHFANFFLLIVPLNFELIDIFNHFWIISQSIYSILVWSRIFVWIWLHFLKS